MHVKNSLWFWGCVHKTPHHSEPNTHANALTYLKAFPNRTRTLQHANNAASYLHVAGRDQILRMPTFVWDV